MPAPSDFDRAGVLMFFGVLALIGALIGLFQGSYCAGIKCSSFFLLLAVFLIGFGIKKTL
jgi:ABC-type xylose transport system permease subunit